MWQNVLHVDLFRRFSEDVLLPFPLVWNHKPFSILYLYYYIR